MDETNVARIHNRGGPSGSLWSFQREEWLKRLWPTDLSRAEIAEALGVSALAVRGKSRRLGLPLRRQPLKSREKTPSDERKPHEPKRFRAKSVGVKQKPKAIRAVPVIESLFGGPKLATDLAFGECRFAVAIDEEGRHLFCGAPVAGSGSWCAEHRAIVFTPRRILATSEATA